MMRVQRRDSNWRSTPHEAPYAILPCAGYLCPVQLAHSPPADDLECDVDLVAGPLHEAAGVAAIGEDAGEKG